MKAIVHEIGGPDTLRLTEVPAPVPGEGEVLIDVVAVGVNRADLLQRQGHYPPPPGASDLLGLECSGIVAAAPPEAAVAPGDPVCALLSGGGYAEQVAVPAGQVLRVPTGVGLVAAAALPEVACTVYSNLVDSAHLEPGDWLLAHGGGSGIGTFAIQWARALGARVAVTAGSEDKVEKCNRLGADLAINYREADFVEELRIATGGAGANVILDIIGAAYLERNLRSLATDGRLVIIGLQGGLKSEINLGYLLSKRGTVAATSLRSRSTGDKARICRAVAADVWPLVEAGEIEPIIDRVLPLNEAADAHRLLAAGDHFGKVVLRVR